MKNIIYNKTIINNLTNQIFFNGKKNYVFGVLSALQYFYTKKPLSALNILTTFLYKNRPFLETREIKKGSVFYQVPFFIKSNFNFLFVPTDFYFNLDWDLFYIHLYEFGSFIITNERSISWVLSIFIIIVIIIIFY